MVPPSAPRYVAPRRVGAAAGTVAEKSPTRSSRDVRLIRAIIGQTGGPTQSSRDDLDEDGAAS